jgi:CheY-specific phosphatase CheX
VSKTELENALANCTETVLEQMFFVHALQAAATAVTAADSDLICGVEFDGDPSGRLALRLDRGAARSIAADFLGEEEDRLSDSRIHQVVCELANIICGSVLSRIESGTTFRLDSPRLLPSWQGAAGNAVVHSVMLDTGALTVEFSTERPVCPLGA